MKELLRKYTRTQDQRVSAVLSILILAVAILSAIFAFPLFLLFAYTGVFLGIMSFIVLLISRWVSKGDRN